MTDTSREAVERTADSLCNMAMRRAEAEVAAMRDNPRLGVENQSDGMDDAAILLRALLTRAEAAEARLAEAVKTLNACRGTFKRLKFEDESIAILAIDQTLAKIKGETNDE